MSILLYFLTSQTICQKNFELTTKLHTFFFKLRLAPFLRLSSCQIEQQRKATWHGKMLKNHSINTSRKGKLISLHYVLVECIHL